MMMMRASPVIQAPELGVLQREVFPITSYFQFPGYQANRNYGVRICYPRQLRFCQSESVESVVDESLNFRTVPQSLCLAEKEEAKVVLTPTSKKLSSKKLRTKKLGAMAPVSEIRSDGQPYSVVPYLLDLGLDMDQIKSITRRQPDFADYSLEGEVKPVVEFLLILGINRADIDTILSRSPELSRISLTEKLIPTMIYLECLGVADKKKWAKVIYRCPGLLTYSRQRLKRTVDYLYELGLTAERVGNILTRFPRIASLSVEENLRPTAQYFRSLGVVDIGHLIRRAPQVFGLSVTENVIPTMTYLENLGVDKKKWAKVIYRYPGLLSFSRQKIKATVDFFYELGLTVESVGKILTRYPQMVGYSVEENLRPTAEYFSSLGVDVAVLVYHAPQVLGLSIEGNLKPVTEFFLEKGYTIEEVGTMFSRFGPLLCYSLLANIIPKWEFFLTMHYPMSGLVKFPQYFGYSLEKRIKPRYALVRESGVLKLHLSQVLSVTEPKFEEVLKRRVKKKLDGLVGSNMEGFDLNISDVQIETTL